MPDSIVPLQTDTLTQTQQVKTLKIQAINPATGAPIMVEMQVISIADKDGNPLTFRALDEVLPQIFDKLDEIGVTLEQVCDILTPQPFAKPTT